MGPAEDQRALLSNWKSTAHASALCCCGQRRRDRRQHGEHAGNTEPAAAYQGASTRSISMPDCSSALGYILVLLHRGLRARAMQVRAARERVGRAGKQVAPGRRKGRGSASIRRRSDQHRLTGKSPCQAACPGW